MDKQLKKVKQLVIENGKIVEQEVEQLKDVFINIQELLDGILPALIPLGLTLMCYTLIKKKNWSPTKCIMLLLVIGIVGCVFGIWAGDYKVPELLSAFIKWHK